MGVSGFNEGGLFFRWGASFFSGGGGGGMLHGGALVLMGRFRKNRRIGGVHATPYSHSPTMGNPASHVGGIITGKICGNGQNWTRLYWLKKKAANSLRT